MSVILKLSEESAAARDCPFCTQRRSTRLMALTVAQIAGANWSYRPLLLQELEQLAQGDYPIVRCDECGFVYASRLPSRDFLDYVYDKVIDTRAARQHSYSAGSMAIRMRYLAQFMPMLEGGRKVLDFGCGFGPTLTLLSRVESIDAHGFETSALRANELRLAGLANVHEEFDAVAAAAPFAGLILDNVLEHMPDPQQSVRLLARVCSPGALAYVSVPDMGARRLAIEVRRHADGHQTGMEINPWEHLNYFDLGHLDAMLGRAGFTPLRQMDLTYEVQTGLRPENDFSRRVRNALATSWRLAKYAITGDAIATPSVRFYRLDGGRPMSESKRSKPYQKSSEAPPGVSD